DRAAQRRGRAAYRRVREAEVTRRPTHDDRDRVAPGLEIRISGLSLDPDGVDARGHGGGPDRVHGDRGPVLGRDEVVLGPGWHVHIPRQRDARRRRLIDDVVGGIRGVVIPAHQQRNGAVEGVVAGDGEVRTGDRRDGGG